MCSWGIFWDVCFQESWEVEYYSLVDGESWEVEYYSLVDGEGRKS